MNNELRIRNARTELQAGKQQRTVEQRRMTDDEDRSIEAFCQRALEALASRPSGRDPCGSSDRGVMPCSALARAHR
jgi:hypothetical protein